MQFYLILSLVFAIIIAIFAIQNSVPVSVRFLWWNIADISLVLVILASALMGAVMALLPALTRQIKLMLRIRELAEENAKLQAGNKPETPNPEPEKEETELPTPIN